MRIARPILAFLIALSVAVLPAAGHMGAHLKPMDMADMTEMSAMDDMACCPHKGAPAGKLVDHCAVGAGCVLCFTLWQPVFHDVVSPVFIVSRAVFFASNPLEPQSGSPPFRPPRA
jgi:hypothetical protein